MVPASINVDPINPVVSQEIDDENQQVSNNSTTLKTCECYECDREVSKNERYLMNGERVCNYCAYKWRVMDKLSTYYFHGNDEIFNKIVHEANIKVKKAQEKAEAREKAEAEAQAKEAKEIYDIYSNFVSRDKEFLLKDAFIMPYDAILIDSETMCCTSFENAKETLNIGLSRKQPVIHDLDEIYVVSQQNGRFWYVLSQVVDKPMMFKVALYAKKDEVAKKYLVRELEDCMYTIDYTLYPEDYQHDGQEEVSVVESVSVVEEPIIKCFHCEKELNDGQEYVDNNHDYCYSCADDLFYQEPVSIVPIDAKLIDECTFHPGSFESYEYAKHALIFAIRHRVTQELPNSYVVAYYRFKKCRWWCVLEQMENDGFKLSLYAPKDEVAMKYLRRQMEEVVDRMHTYEDGDLDNESDAGDPDFCHSCAPSTAATSAPFCCTDHMLCFEKGNGLKWCGGVEKLYKCNICECESYYRSERHEKGYGWYASLNTDKGIRPIDSAICMFDELGLNNLMFENLFDLNEYFQ